MSLTDDDPERTLRSLVEELVDARRAEGEANRRVCGLELIIDGYFDLYPELRPVVKVPPPAPRQRRGVRRGPR